MTVGNLFRVGAAGGRSSLWSGAVPRTRSGGGRCDEGAPPAGDDERGNGGTEQSAEAGSRQGGRLSDESGATAPLTAQRESGGDFPDAVRSRRPDTESRRLPVAGRRRSLPARGRGAQDRRAGAVAGAGERRWLHGVAVNDCPAWEVGPIGGENGMPPPTAGHRLGAMPSAGGQQRAGGIR